MESGIIKTPMNLEVVGVSGEKKQRRT